MEDISGNEKPHPYRLSIPPPPLPPPLLSRFPTVPIPPPPIPPFLSHFPDNPGFYPSPGSVCRTPLYPAVRFPTDISANHANPHEGKYSKETSRLECQALVDDWLRRRGIVNRVPKKQNKNCVKIYLVRENLNEAFKLVRELENGVRTLNVMAKTVAPHEWDQKCEEIETKKHSLVKIMNDLKMSPEELNILKEKCSKRSKKRARLRRQAERYKNLKEEEQVRDQNLHFQIDNWQREMQEEVERAQREEELQKEADAVLWGVTQKKAEARRQVALLTALLELRQVRVKRLTAAGTPVPQSQIDTFNTVIERLKDMWTSHLGELGLEEQALRGMLTEAEVKGDPVKTYKKLVLQEWETALFGSVGTMDSDVKGDELIELRRTWDQFAVHKDTVLASSIPAGWVLPAPPSSDDWRTLLKY